MGEETSSQFAIGHGIDRKDELGIGVFIHTFRDGLFGVLFAANKTATTSGVGHNLRLAIEHLQDLAFPIGFQLLLWQPEINWIQTITRWSSPAPLLASSNLVYIVIICFIVIVSTFLAVAGCSFKSQHAIRISFALKLLFGCSTLFTTVLFIPVLSFLVNVIVNCDGSGTPSVCWSSPFVLKTVGALLTSLFYLVTCLLVKATLFKTDPTKDDVASGPHSRIEVLYLACRTLLVAVGVCMSSIGDSYVMNLSTAQWLMTLTCLGCSLILSQAYFWYVPFYNLRYACLRSVLMNNFLWASLCMLYTLIRPLSDAGIFFIAVAPLVAILSVYGFYHRLDVLRKAPLRSITDPYLIELKARIKLIDSNLLFPKSEHDEIAGPVVVETKINIHGKKRSGNSKTDTDRIVLDEINELYIQAAKILPKSCMLSLFAGTFQLNQMKNRSQCLAIYAKAATLSPALDESFMIFCRKRMLNERFSGGEVVNFIAFEQNLKLARMNEKKATLAVVQFWSELLKKQPSFQNLQQYGSTIAKTTTTAQSHYMKLLKLSPDAPSVYRMYGSFLINIFNDTKQGQELLDRAAELESRDEFGQAADDDYGGLLSSKTNIDLFSNENGQVTISGEIQSLGIIKNANQAFLSIFGFKRAEVIGHKLQVIIPEPFATMHDGFLRAYLETGVKKLLDTSRQVVGLNRDGYLFPFDLLAKHMVDASGRQSFVGICRPVKMSPNLGFMILDAELHILHFSLLLGQQFNVKPFEKTNGKLDGLLTITAWFPGITLETVGNLTAKGGYSVSGMATAVSSLASFHIKSEELEINEAIYFICEVRLLSSEAIAVETPNTVSDESIMKGGGCPFKASLDDFTMELDNPVQNVDDTEKLPPATLSRRQSLLNAPHRKAGEMPLPSITTLSRKESTGQERYKTLEHISERGSLAHRPSAASAKRDSKPDREDAHSLGSSSYNSSKRDQTTNFVRRAIKIKNDLSSLLVFRLHLTFFLCYSVLISLAIYQTEDFSFIMNTLNSKIEQVSSHAKASANVMAAISKSRVIDLWRVGGHWVSSPLALPLQTTQASIVQISQSIRQDPYIVYRFSLLDIDLTINNGDGDVVQNPLTVLLTTTGNLFDIGHANLSDPTLPRKISYVISNGIPGLAYALNYSSTIVRDEFRDFYQGKPMSTMIKASIGPILSLIIIFGLRFPLHWQIEVENERFLKMFYEIPKEVALGIFQQNYQRLMDAQEDEEDDDDTDLATKLEVEKALGLNTTVQAESGASRSKSLSKNQAIIKEHEKGLFQRIPTWFVDKNKFALKTLVLFMAAFVYFYTTGVVLLCLLMNVGDVANQLFWTAQRPALLYESYHMLRRQYITLAMPYFPTSVPLAPYLDGVTSPTPTDVFDRLDWTENAVLHGSDIIQINPISTMNPSSVDYYYELISGCTEASPPDCKTYLNGVCSQGVYHMLENHLTRSRALSKWLSSRTVVPLNFSSIETEIASIRDLLYNYTSYPLFAVVDLNVEDVCAKTLWFTNVQMIFTVVYVIVLVILYVTIVRPFVYGLDEDLQHTSILAFIVPSEVFYSVPSFKHWLANQKDKRETHHRNTKDTYKDTKEKVEETRNPTILNSVVIIQEPKEC